jgi:hypothetical protein
VVLNENYSGIFALVSIDLATKEGSLAIVYRYQYIRALAGSVSRIHCRVSVPHFLPGQCPAVTALSVSRIHCRVSIQHSLVTFTVLLLITYLIYASIRWGTVAKTYTLKKWWLTNDNKKNFVSSKIGLLNLYNKKF